MMSFINAAIHLDLASVIKTVGYVGIFAIIFAESGLIVAFYLPGGSLLFTAGLLASQGFLNIWILIPLLWVAAVLGDNAGYWFGKNVGARLFTHEDSWVFHKKHAANAKQFYEKYGTKAVLLARFVPIVRTFVPVVAGVGSMKYGAFIKFNMIGAFAWAVGVALLGYFLGAAFPQISHYLTYIILLIIFVSILPIIFEFIKNRRSNESHRATN
jgi:membrane-associated protein